jgi:undecaprenyl-diphosphatase
LTNLIPLLKKNKGAAIPNPKTLPSFLDAAIIGIAQGVAGLPGISRSGATICAARLTGVEKEASAEFSFLLSVPIIIGSSIFEFIGGDGLGGVSVGPLMIGFVSAFAVGFAAVKFMLKFIAKRGMNVFAAYLMILTVFMIVDRFFLGIF